jgi:hypothetical protein
MHYSYTHNIPIGKHKDVRTQERRKSRKRRKEDERGEEE